MTPVGNTEDRISVKLKTVSVGKPVCAHVEEYLKAYKGISMWSVIMGKFVDYVYRWNRQT